MKKTIVAVLMLLSCIGIAVADTNNSLTAVVELTEVSSFVFRGAILDDTALLQPNVTLNKATGYGDVFFNTWASINPKDYTSKGQDSYREVDLTLGYANMYKKFGYGIGLIDYILVSAPTNAFSTHEIYINVYYDYIIKPAVTVYYDFKEIQGVYTFANLSYTLNILESLQTVVDTGLGYANTAYNDYRYEVNKNSINDWNSGLTINYTIIKNIVASVQGRYYNLLDSEISDNAEEIYGSGEKWVGKATVAVKF